MVEIDFKINNKFFLSFFPVSHCILGRVRRLLLVVMANVPSSPILVTLMMEALSSSETSVLTRSTQHSIQ
jgi:hypothetical protein